MPIEFNPEEQAILSGSKAGRTSPPSRSAPRRESTSGAPSSSPPRGKSSAGGGNPSTQAPEKPPRESWWDWGAGIAKGVGTDRKSVV